MQKMTTKTILRTLVIVVLSSTVAPAAQQRGILGKPAPSLGVSNWINLPKGKKTIDVLGHRGKVVYLYCFQSWCPACNSHGFPLLKKVAKHYEGEDDVVFLAVQTVFEGFRTNTAARAKAVAVGKFKLDIPIGHDAGPDGKRSVVLNRYRTGGTPWVVLIGKKGVVRYNDFGTDVKPADAIRHIDRLRGEGGLVGSALGGFGKVEFAGKPFPIDAQEFTLIRWWTDSCPFCKDSLPALEALRKRHADLEVLAMYHAKPLRPVTPEKARRQARKLKFRGPVAVDQGWKLLNALRKRGLPPRYTSVSVLVDKRGMIRWVHAGPRLHENSGGKHAKAAADLSVLSRFLATERARRSAVEERAKKSKVR